MFSIDNKIPPPVIALLCIGAAWQISEFFPDLTISWQPRIAVAAIIGFVGLILDILGLLAFRRASTTVNPLCPERTNVVVHSGIYSITRNPMYLGLALMLLGFCVYLGNPLSLIVIIAFIIYITHYQILPEERVLIRKFGKSYQEYLNKVNRWI